MAEQGLMQFLEQNGVLTSTSSIEYDYQMRISAADSTEKLALQKEMAEDDSVNKLNAPQLNQFIKGLKDAINLEEKSAYAQGLSIGAQFSQMMLPQVNSLLYGEESGQKINTAQLLSGLAAVLKSEQPAMSAMDASAYFQQEVEKAQAAEVARQEEKLKVEYAESIAEGEAFMEENSKRGAVTLPSGLQYEVLKQGRSRPHGCRQGESALPRDAHR